MKDLILKTFMNIVSIGYERIFHEGMNDDVKKIFKDFTFVGAGTVISTIFYFSVNILAARVLGPSGSGAFALVQSVAMFLYIPMLLGFSTAMVKYNAEIEDFARQQRILSTTYISVSMFTIISLAIYFIFLSQISKIFSISKEFFYLSAVFAAIYAFYTLSTSTLRSLHKMKIYAIFQPIYSIILLSAFLIFIIFNFISFEAMVFSMYIAYGITGGFILFIIRNYLRFDFDCSWASRLSKYGVYSIIGGISSAFYLNIDKILINKYMTVTDVGIYSAYSYSVTGVMTILISIFITVFFPVASKSQDKHAIFKKINKLVPYLIAFGLPLAVGSGFIILKLYGPKYPFDLKLASLCGLAGICISVDSIYGWLMNAVGMEGVKITSKAAVVLALVNIILNITLIQLIGIEGAIISTIVSYIISIYIVLSKRKYFYNSDVA